MSEDLIRRSDAIKAIASLHILADEEKIFKVYADNPHSMTTDFEGTLIDAINAIKSIPSADRPTVIRVKSIMRKEDYDDLEKRIKQQNPNVIVIPHNAELVTDRPQGEWIGEADGYYNGELIYDTWYCSNCDYVVDDEEPPTWNFCPNCGADMRGADDE